MIDSYDEAHTEEERNEYDDRLADAYSEFISRKMRKKNPYGHFDDAGRFYLDVTERRDCCMDLRRPTRAYPYSEMLHARTIVHVAHLYGVSVKDLRKYAYDRRLNEEVVEYLDTMK